VGLYFQELAAHWPTKGPDLWGIIEVFKQTSTDGEPFAAVPAAPDRVRRQIDSASRSFGHLVLFSFLDYMDPSRGGESAALYRGLLSPETAPKRAAPAGS
jgi:hypothetical protein